jgi:crotonobetainyl-CoA:carnitine CoA-transferase CaiB-like acyl-CoA transferase
MSSDSPPPGTERDAPLRGVRVIEAAVMYAAPFAGKILRDFGAEVIKVEDPNGGDQSRRWTPARGSHAIGFLRVNAGKKSVAIDLRDPSGQELLRDLCVGADIVIENFRPGRMEAWGLGYKDLAARNPGIVMVRVSGYGQTGPYRDRPGFGTIAEAVSGFAYVNGWPETPPTSAPFGLGDSVAGMAAAFGALMGLQRRAATGKGDEIDVALYEPMLHILGDVVLRYSALGYVLTRLGSVGDASTSPRGIYQTQDGEWIAIAGSSQTVVERLFRAMERPEMIEDPRYATNAARVQHDAELQRIVEEWVRSRPRRDVLAILDKYEVAAGPVNSAKDIVEDAAMRERGSIVEVDSKVLGKVAYPGTMLKARSYAGPAFVDAPALGEHTRTVLREVVGRSEEQISALEQAGVIACAEAAV